MKEEKTKEIGELIEALLKSFKEMDSKTLEKFPQLKRIKGQLEYPEKPQIPLQDYLVSIKYRVKYSVMLEI